MSSGNVLQRQLASWLGYAQGRERSIRLGIAGGTSSGKTYYLAALHSLLKTFGGVSLERRIGCETFSECQHDNEALCRFCSLSRQYRDMDRIARTSKELAVRLKVEVSVLDQPVEIRLVDVPGEVIGRRKADADWGLFVSDLKQQRATGQPSQLSEHQRQDMRYRVSESLEHTDGLFITLPFWALDRSLSDPLGSRPGSDRTDAVGAAAHQQLFMDWLELVDDLNLRRGSDLRIAVLLTMAENEDWCRPVDQHLGGAEGFRRSWQAFAREQQEVRGQRRLAAEQEFARWTTAAVREMMERADPARRGPFFNALELAHARRWELRLFQVSVGVCEGQLRPAPVLVHTPLLFLLQKHWNFMA